MGKIAKIFVLILALTMAMVAVVPVLAVERTAPPLYQVSGIILEVVSGDLNKTFLGSYLIKSDDGKTLAFKIISGKTGFDNNKDYYSYKKGDRVLVMYNPDSVNSLSNTYDAVRVDMPSIQATTDLTPRISIWYGKVNQHVNTTTGKWETDPDGVSGANIDTLTYCKKWYPKTSSYKLYKKEKITFYDRGNTQSYWSKDAYTIENSSYQCVASKNSKLLPDLIIMSIGLNNIDVNNNNDVTLYVDVKNIGEGAKAKSGFGVSGKINGRYTGFEFVKNYGTNAEVLEPGKTKRLERLYSRKEWTDNIKYLVQQGFIKNGDNKLTLTVDSTCPDGSACQTNNYIEESNESNNSYTANFYYNSATGKVSVFKQENKDDTATCTMDYTPVCGADGKVYSNSCFASLNKIKVDYPGLCKISGDTYVKDGRLKLVELNYVKNFTNPIIDPKSFNADNSEVSFTIQNISTTDVIWSDYYAVGFETIIKDAQGKIKYKFGTQHNFNVKASKTEIITRGIICSFCNDSKDIKFAVGDTLTIKLYANKSTDILDEKTFSITSSNLIDEALSSTTSENSDNNQPTSVNQPVAVPVYQPKTTAQAKPVLENIKGKIVLQVEKNGEAYYSSPKTKKIYYLKDGNAAYQTMRETGLGISEKDFLDLMSSNSRGQELRKKLAGQIVLRVEPPAMGEAYYINPANLSVTYMPDGEVAYQIMRQQGLGISNENLFKVIDVKK
ncbi:MAG: hypothetical protein Q8O59_03010 [bacterium]|nr:hypothetical protein [bacterium]